MIEVSDFKKGVCIEFKGAPMMIVEVTFSTPTARGGNTIAKTKLRKPLAQIAHLERFGQSWEG